MRGREKVKLSPIVQHILRFAAAADSSGVASLPHLLDALYASFGAGKPEHFLSFAEKGLRICWKLGYLYLDRVVDGTRRSILVPEWERLALGEVVVWDAGRNGWQLRRHQRGMVSSWTAGWVECEMRWQHDEVEDVLVHLTQGGIKALALYEKQHPLESHRNGNLSYH